MRALAALTLAITMSASGQVAAPALELVRFVPESRSIPVGGTAESELVVRNSGQSAVMIWIGYSVRDSTGTWFDVPADSIVIGRQSTGARRMGWLVPASAQSGQYRVVMAVWTGPPGQAGSVRLLAVERDAAFTVRGAPSLLMEQPRLPWRVASHPLGRGTMQPTGVLTDGESFHLRLRARRCDGAEMRTSERVGFGTYSAQMRVPDAPGSLSAFFLYGDASHDNDEIDIEIFNDGSRRALLTAWVAGRKSREREIRLQFDPRAGLHEYAIDWRSSALEFLIDGRSVARWTRGFPQRPMRLVANVWWPTWLECAPLVADRELVIQSIRLRPDSTETRPR